MFIMNLSTGNIFSLLLLIPSFAIAREIVFPPVPTPNSYQASFGDRLDDVDIVSDQKFSGLTTFANLPYVGCFDERVEVQKYDVAFLGAPFDTVSAAKLTLKTPLSF